MRIEWFGRQQNQFPMTSRVPGGGVSFSHPGHYGPVEIKPSEEIPVDFGDDDKWTPADGHWLANLSTCICGFQIHTYPQDWEMHLCRIQRSVVHAGTRSGSARFDPEVPLPSYVPDELARHQRIIKDQAAALAEWRKKADEDAGRLARYRSALMMIAYWPMPEISARLMQERAQRELEGTLVRHCHYSENRNAQGGNASMELHSILSGTAARGVARKKPIKKRRSKPRRSLALRCPAYIVWLHHQRCEHCGALNPDPAHGPAAGRGMKGPDNEALPLCHPVHLWVDGQAKLPNGDVGRAATVAFLGWDTPISRSWNERALSWWTTFCRVTGRDMRTGNKKAPGPRAGLGGIERPASGGKPRTGQAGAETGTSGGNAGSMQE
jgi:hypothetical protein